MGAYNRVINLGVAAASANNIALSQSKGSAGNLLLNGSTGGVLTYATQIRLVFAADESGHTFTITGTDANGQVITENIAGTTAGTVNSVKNYLTITSISVNAATTGALTVGTNAVGNSSTYIVDKFVNPAVHSIAAVVTGTISFSIQVAADDFSPAWDLVTNPPNWLSPGSGFAAQSASLFSSIQGPITMIRVIQASGTGSVSVTVNTPFPSN